MYSRALARPEIEDSYLAVWTELDVGWFEVAVDDALVVCGFQRLGNLEGDLEGLIDRGRTGVDALGQGFTLGHLHDQQLASLEIFETVDRSDPRVLKCGQDPGFAFESGPAVRRPR